jgi:hypothetical protein
MKLYVPQCFLAFREWAAVVSSYGCDHPRYTKQAVRRGDASRAVVDTDELSHGSASGVPAFLRGSSLCAGLPVSQADHE